MYTNVKRNMESNISKKYYCLENISFELIIEMTKSNIQIGSSYNHFEHPNASIIDISHTWIHRFENDEMVLFTQKELNEIAFIGPITFIDYVTKTFKNTKGYFTVSELVQNIVEFAKYHFQQNFTNFMFWMHMKKRLLMKKMQLLMIL